jgi:hypothetical protein
VATGLHQAAPHHLPMFFTAPGETDVLMVGTGVFLIAVVLLVGVLYWRLHALPEHIAHKSHKLQLEIVAVLGLISLFTHMHIFWIIGLLLAMIDLPDFGNPLRRMAGSLEKMSGMQPGEGDAAVPTEPLSRHAHGEATAEDTDKRPLTLAKTGS